jgi:hypothetical protein
MRARLKTFLPIVLLALVVQLIAPIAAFRVVANAVSDPLYMAEICSGMTASVDTSQSTPAPMQHGMKCCAFCSAGAAVAVAIDPPPAAFVVLHRQYQLVAWLEPVQHLPAVRAGSNAQARAPPAIS